MGTRTICIMALTLVFVACTDDSAETATTSDAGTTTGSVTTTGVEPEVTTAVTSHPGRLVLLDGAGNIVVLDPDGSKRRAITDDAGESALYTQPIWSPDASRLAWGQLTESGFAVGYQDADSAEATTVETPNLPFYMSWSPDGRRLGVLHNGTSGLDFRMVDVDDGTDTVIDQGSPLYFSWSLDGSVVTHVGADKVENIRPDGERLSLEPTDAGYLAPHWTPKGVFHVANGQLLLEAATGDRAPVVIVSELTMFVSNREGTRVALQTTGADPGVTISLGEAPTVPSGTVVVVDVESAEFEVVSDDLALGFFWSPDGESLLVMTATPAGVVPRVWTAGTDAKDFSTYRPPGVMIRDTLPFFPQYAQSVSFWAPDSSAFAFAGDIDGDRGIWVQNVIEDVPTRVSDGVWVAWSP